MKLRDRVNGARLFGLAILSTLVVAACVSLAGAHQPVHIHVTSRETGETLPARLYVRQLETGVHFFVESLSPEGTAVPYDVARSPTSFERHTTVSAHPCRVQLPAGSYVLIVERGPEYHSHQTTFEVGDQPLQLEVPLQRWIDMAERGWYSGDTHVHRSLEELPNVMRAEDLNVALPLSYWVRDAYTPPAQGDKTIATTVQPELIEVDRMHVIWPVNTEYELFTVNGARHTLGAVFVLNHKRPLTLAAPPVAPIAAEAREQGALLDLDKHSWPWSLMLVPIMDVDLFELSNNHIWRTEFFFKQWTQEMRPEGWNIETDADGFTEWGWIEFGFKTYYALLNCGFKMRPTAGTASGVHPVPLGFGRVYVQLPGEFSYDNWMTGLDAGRSFVTTGPMLFAEVDGQPPGSSISIDGPTTVRVHGSAEGPERLHRIEIVRNGRVVDVVPAQNDQESPESFRTSFDVTVPVATSSWIAVRCFAGNAADERTLRFAHSAPVHITLPGQPLQPRKIETDYFIRRMEEEIDRNRDVLSSDELAEYERARDIYRQIGQTARDDKTTTDEELLSLVPGADDLPDGWEFADHPVGELPALGSNPDLVLRPDRTGALFKSLDTDELDRCNLLRSLVACCRHPQSDRFAILSANVCADKTSARDAAELLSSRPHLRGRSQTWQRDDLVVWVSVSEDMPDAEWTTFTQGMAARIQQIETE